MHRTVLVFGSSRGNTKLVANRVAETFSQPVDVIPAGEVLDAGFFAPYDICLFFASTWGDGELQDEMESLFVRMRLNLVGKRFAICELGNYYGYDDFEFGALRIMQHFLDASGGEELIEPFCMDSLPKKDWLGLSRWVAALETKLKALP